MTSINIKKKFGCPICKKRSFVNLFGKRYSSHIKRCSNSNYINRDSVPEQLYLCKYYTYGCNKGYKLRNGKNKLNHELICDYQFTGGVHPDDTPESLSSPVESDDESMESKNDDESSYDYNNYPDDIQEPPPKRRKLNIIKKDISEKVRPGFVLDPNNPKVTDKMIDDWAQTVSPMAKNTETIYWLKYQKDEYKVINKILNALIRRASEMDYYNRWIFHFDVATQNAASKVGIKSYAYNPWTIPKLKHALQNADDPFYEKLSSSDTFADHLLKGVGMTVTMLPRARSKPMGGSWNRVIKINLDLRKFGIYNESQAANMDFETPCLITALKPQINDYYHSQEKINLLKSLLNDQVVRKIRLRLICEQIKCNIEIKQLYITYDQNENIGGYTKTYLIKPKLKDKNLPTFKIGLVDNHYFRNDILVPITSYALTNYESIKNEFYFNNICGKNKNGTWQRKDSRFMKPSAFFRKLILNHSNLLSVNNQVFDNENLEPQKSYKPQLILGSKVTTKKAYNHQTRGTTNLQVFKTEDYKTKMLKHNKIRNAKSLMEIKAEMSQCTDYRYNEIKVSEEVSCEIQDRKKLNKLLSIPNIHKTLALIKYKRDKTKSLSAYEKNLKYELSNLNKNINQNNLSYTRYNKIRGRDYAVTFGIQNESKLLRGLLCKDYYLDIDMVNAHYVIANHLYKFKYKLNTACMEHYVNNRESFIKELIDAQTEYELSRSDVKRILLVALNGGKNIVADFMEDFIITKNFKALIDEIYKNQQKIFATDKLKIQEYINRRQLRKKKSTKLTYLNDMYSQVECTLLNEAIRIFKECNVIKYNIYTKIFDGFQVFMHSDLTLVKLNECINKVNKTMVSKYKINMKFKRKEIERIVSMQDLLPNDQQSYSTSLMFMQQMVEKQKENIMQQAACGNVYNVGFFDLETDTSYFDEEDQKYYHKEYSASWCINKSSIKNAIGTECIDFMLKDVPHRTIMYAHNLNYDYRFVCRHPEVKFSGDIVYFNNRMMSCDIIYKEKLIKLKDSYTLINMPLSKFPEMFDIKCEKEVYPYNLFKLETMFNAHYKIEDALKHIKPEDKNAFLRNLKRLNIINRKDKTFNHFKYIQFYNNQDVYILRRGYEKFRKSILSLTEKHPYPLDIDKIISSSGLGERFAYNQKAFDNTAILTGLTRAFVQRSVAGGCTRSWNNYKLRVSQNKIYYIDASGIEKTLVTKNQPIRMVDFDAVSLYPSAMKFMKGVPIGRPKIAKGIQLTWGFLKNQTCCFAEIKITKVNKHRNMPIMSVKINNKTYFDDRLYVNRSFVLSNIRIEDLLKYHEIEFEVTAALYWNEGTNDHIGKMIEQLFKERLVYKKNKNKLEKIVKLFMNSIYGKTLIKEQKYIYKFANSHMEYVDVVNKELDLVNEVIKIKGDEKYILQIKQDILKHSNSVHIGCLILDWSKRLMNEVICLAEDLKIYILYQDTDSIHVDINDINRLKRKFKETYGKDLIGKNLGQFHSDFDVPADLAESNYEPRALETIIVGKKSYYDKIICNSKNETTDHIRMKGITHKAILKYCKDKNISISQLYLNLYNGSSVEFNLSEVRPIFKLNRNLTIVSDNAFTRRVKYTVEDVTGYIL